MLSMIKETKYSYVRQNNRNVIIGFGSYGEVILVCSNQSGTLRLIKIYGKRADEQIKIHKQLYHPNIIQLMDYHYDPVKNTTFMVVEYAGGGSLHKLIKTTNIKKQQIKRIFRETCKGVQALHDSKMMHRDIKPENILLTEKKEVKLCDFGLASFLGDRKTICGTHQYMSPQMIQKQAYDHKVDIWALGNAPFQGNTGEEVLYQMKKVIMFSDKFQQDDISLIKKILRVKPINRPSIQQILQHPFCKQSKQKKSIRTTVSSDNQQKLAKSSSININKSFFQSINHQPKLPSSPSLPETTISQTRPISMNSYICKDFNVNK